MEWKRLYYVHAHNNFDLHQKQGVKPKKTLVKLGCVRKQL